jgi:hypothetical protein
METWTLQHHRRLRLVYSRTGPIASILGCLPVHAGNELQAFRSTFHCPAQSTPGQELEARLRLLVQERPTDGTDRVYPFGIASSLVGVSASGKRCEHPCKCSRLHQLAGLRWVIHGWIHDVDRLDRDIVERATESRNGPWMCINRPSCRRYLPGHLQVVHASNTTFTYTSHYIKPAQQPFQHGSSQP